MRKVLHAFGRESAASQVFAGYGAFRAAQLLFEKGGCGLVQFQQFGSLARFGGFFGRGELALGQGNAELLRDDPDGFRKADVLDFARRS